MGREVNGGFSLIEVLAALALAGLALGGITRLATAAARCGGDGERRMRARWAALGALDPGAPPGTEGVAVAEDGGRRVARVAWPGGGLRLETWTGHG
ncbi:prepilin-type N-terminal cleavage/methylation domain-containing protein [Mesoterricola silvestris]|uniref:Prepilin-type N-terminal cleavage/methylation domain-containing protein n=1 Tax=Mesoterricola silvestris TaxID=2927979 RepID=A0AA48GSU4_9BACT|nr:prepilin-type N-terminal cleavage/methylation domain-containing protein [Mesoterricola silvestris]BDU73367.1 hypothetical protein METEAL_25410 [Mesoterricola silvestris]